MSFKKITTISEITNPYWKYVHETYTIPNGEIEDYYYAKTNGSTMIIGLLENDKLLMTKQFRYLNQKDSIEFPGGGIANGLSPNENAIKELLEETGYIADSIEKIAEFNPCNGLTNEICSVFLAKNLNFNKKIFDAKEIVHNIELSIPQIKEMIRKNEIWDGMTLAVFSFYVSLYL